MQAAREAGKRKKISASFMVSYRSIGQIYARATASAAVNHLVAALLARDHALPCCAEKEQVKYIARISLHRTTKVRLEDVVDNNYCFQ